jgi:hypothetical protein
MSDGRESAVLAIRQVAANSNASPLSNLYVILKMHNFYLIMHYDDTMMVAVPRFQRRGNKWRVTP